MICPHVVKVLFHIGWRYFTSLVIGFVVPVQCSQRSHNKCSGAHSSLGRDPQPYGRPEKLLTAKIAGVF